MTKKVNVKLLSHPLLPCIAFWQGFKTHYPLKIKFTLKEKAHKNSFVLTGNVVSKKGKLEESVPGWELRNIRNFVIEKELHFTGLHPETNMN